MTITLVTVDAAGHQLAPAAAASYLRMRADGCPAGITSAYRSVEQQAAMRAQYLRDLSAGLNPAYVAPVETSGHPLGTRVDFPEPARTWVRLHGAHYGWDIGIENPAEPWHARHTAAHDQSAALGGASTSRPTSPPTPQEDPLMKLVRVKEDGRIFLLGPCLWELIPDMQTATALAAVYGTWVDVSIDAAQRLNDQVNHNITATAANLAGQWATTGGIKVRA